MRPATLRARLRLGPVLCIALGGITGCDTSTGPGGDYLDGRVIEVLPSTPGRSYFSVGELVMPDGAPYMSDEARVDIEVQRAAILRVHADGGRQRGTEADIVAGRTVRFWTDGVVYRTDPPTFRPRRVEITMAAPAP